MQELRFVAVSEDGRYAVLAVPGRSARFTLPIDERLRAVALGQTSRLVQYEIEVESPLRPKEIQARIRAGETVEEIADAAGIAVERVRWFEGPVLAERAYIADQAQAASVRRQGDAIPSTPSTPGPRLGEIVTERLKMFGSDPEDAQWDAKKRGDGSWQVQLTFVSGGRLHVAEWVFDQRRRHVLPADENAARMSLPGTEPPLPAAPPPGEATVTQLAPRLSTASGQAGTGTSGFSPAGMGNGGFSNGSRARHEWPGVGRPAVSEPAAQAPPPQAPPPQAPPPPAAAEPVVEVPRPAATGRHSLAPTATEHQVTEPAQPAPEPSAPAAVAHLAPSAPPVSPATVAAQMTRAPQAPQTSRPPQPTRASQPGHGVQEPPAAQPRQETKAPAERQETAHEETARQDADHQDAAVPAARQETAVPETAAPSIGDTNSAPAASPEPAGDQAGRQSRKAARGKRASVPSWDEIMFGNSRQRD
jgi:hypothetical protein